MARRDYTGGRWWLAALAVVCGTVVPARPPHADGGFQHAEGRAETVARVGDALKSALGFRLWASGFGLERWNVFPKPVARSPLYVPLQQIQLTPGLLRIGRLRVLVDDLGERLLRLVFLARSRIGPPELHQDGVDG